MASTLARSVGIDTIGTQWQAEKRGAACAQVPCSKDPAPKRWSRTLQSGCLQSLHHQKEEEFGLLAVLPDMFFNLQQHSSTSYHKQHQAFWDAPTKPRAVQKSAPHAQKHHPSGMCNVFTSAAHALFMFRGCTGQVRRREHGGKT